MKSNIARKNPIRAIVARALAGEVEKIAGVTQITRPSSSGMQ